MSRATRQAITVLGAASIAIQTIANSFEISPLYREKIKTAHGAILKTCAGWPRADTMEHGFVSRNLRAWTDRLTQREMTGAVMASLAAVAVQSVTDLYERPTSRLQRPVLDDLLPLLVEIYDTVEGGKEAAYQANKLADEMMRELYLLVGWEEKKTAWPWDVAA